MNPKRELLGMILRVFATSEEQIPDRIAMVKKMVNRAMAIQIDNRPIISRIDILVWADQRYAGRCDCGKTASKLRHEFPKNKKVFISEVKHGDLYCGLLNYGIAKQLRNSIDYSMIISSEAYNYLNNETVIAMIMATQKGARAVGVAIHELTDSILNGELANTFCLWHNESLFTAGGFDLIAALPVNDNVSEYIWGSDPITNEAVSYVNAGVEEVVPLARLIQIFGQCLVPILPQGEEVKKYETPDPKKYPKQWKRHICKMGTKEPRKRFNLAQNHIDLSYLKSGVMPEYRHF